MPASVLNNAVKPNSGVVNPRKTTGSALSLSGMN